MAAHPMTVPDALDLITALAWLLPAALFGLVRP